MSDALSTLIGCTVAVGAKLTDFVFCCSMLYSVVAAAAPVLLECFKVLAEEHANAEGLSGVGGDINVYSAAAEVRGCIVE
jgi:hypothetical protein